MRVSYEWLSSMVKLPKDPSVLVQEYTRTGTEVEAVETLGTNFDHIVTAKILKKEPHPDSDHLWVTLVDVGSANVNEHGEPEPLQIVCGAQNFEEGNCIVTALEGATLPGDIVIKKSKLRGVASCGMNCSARELGLSADHSGIMILPDDTPCGIPFGQFMGMSDTVLDCEITPNRPDCLSMIGMARETGAILHEDINIDLPVPTEVEKKAEDLVDVTIDDPELCQRYVARVVSGVKIGPSPDWLVKRVTAAGSRSINNVVDVTNYVMYLTGQPLHAFDLGKLEHDEQGKAHIVVRAAYDDEIITTLDGTERKLTHDMAVITDNGKTPVALAGVMGGQNSEIDDSTVDVLLESASFSHAHTSRTSRNLQLFSEAAMRFERTVDPEGCAIAADLAAALFADVCGGVVLAGRIDEYPVPWEPKTLVLRTERLRDMMGAPIDDEFCVESLERLGCKVKETTVAHIFSVVSPSYRPDLEREIDLYEEIVRLWGEGDIAPTIPAARNHSGGLTVEQARKRIVTQTLRSLGLNESLSYAFVPSDDLERLHMTEQGRGSVVELMHPMSSDWTVMRRTLIPGLLRSIGVNQRHGVQNVALYEVGRVYFGRPGHAQPREHEYVSGVLCGSWHEATWNSPSQPFDFFDIKGIVEALLNKLNIQKIRFRVPNIEEYGFTHPGQVAEVLSGGTVLGWLGQIHPQVTQEFEIDSKVFAFELDLEHILQLANNVAPYEEIPTLPAVSLDLALLVDEGVSAEKLEQVMKSAAGKNLETIRLFDIYRDAQKLGEGKKSMAFALTYRAQDHTLTSEEASALHAKVCDKVFRATGAQVRGE